MTRQKKPQKWRGLTAEDIDAILDEAELKASPASRAGLLSRINRRIEEFNFVKEGRCLYSAPGANAARYRSVSEAAARLALLLADSEAINAFGYEFHTLSGLPGSSAPSFEKLRDNHPSLPEGVLAAAAEFFEGKLLVPDRANREVGLMVQSVRALKILADKSVQTALRKQLELNTQKAPRKFDDVRYAFVLALSYEFRRAFKCPKSTEEGPWCLFLAALLSRCEHKKLQPGTAKNLWSKACRWLESP